MITFITNYDESTISNYNVIHPLVPVDAINLIGTNASRINLTHNLSTAPNAPVFVVTHGYERGFYSDAGVTALSIDDSHLLRNRSVFVYACYTANELGKLSSNENCIYWGYTGAISALVDDPLCIVSFIKIFDFIINQFHICTDQPAINAFIRELKDRCEVAESSFDDIFYQDPDFDVMTAYNCTKDIWNRLRVFLQDENVKLVHPEAETGDLFQYS